jgi:hypothetical protein
MIAGRTGNIPGRERRLEVKIALSRRKQEFESLGSASKINNLI